MRGTAGTVNVACSAAAAIDDVDLAAATIDDADSAAAAVDDADSAATANLASCGSRTSSKVGNRSPSICIDATKELATEKKASVFDDDDDDGISLDMPCGNKPARIMIVTVFKPKPGTSKQSSSHRR